MTGTSHQVLTSIAIDAPAHLVWKVLADVDAYSEWNPVIRDVRGTMSQGEPIDFTIRVGPISPSIEARVVCADGCELRWEGPRNSRRNPLAMGSHFFRLEALGETRTRLVHGEEFQGLLIRPIWTPLSRLLRKSYEELNQALKTRAEHLSANSGTRSKIN